MEGNPVRRLAGSSAPSSSNSCEIRVVNNQTGTDMAVRNGGEGSSRRYNEEVVADIVAGGDEDSEGEDDDDSEGRGERDEEEDGGDDDDDEEDLPSSKEDLELEAKFQERVGAMKGEDFYDLHKLEFLTKAGRDLEGRRLFRLVGKYLSVKGVNLDMLKNYVQYMLHRYAQEGDFCIVYIHTEATSENSPGTLWLQSLYRSLPCSYRRRLRAVYILHPALLMRLTLWGVTQYLGDSLAHKLVYVSRIEFLWDYMKEKHIKLPDFVREHDRDLESRPLMDYGLDVDDMMTQSMVNMP
eukprot:TRINITY_DN19855_c0_g1_i1.p1 TRINITY_DN19855_c0_g1~~TRINITY_DN19855_c0_g1_i1.p1  ORF type:complete len:319 (-),score=68.99 TRINITY_DN19855_c0_g1_i1:283-1170(-)